MTLCGLALVLTTSTASAAPSDAMSKMDCSKAPEMMESMPSSMPTMAPGMTVDAAFTGMSHMMMDHAKMMAHMELACGKDPKAKKMAQELLDQIKQFEAEAVRIKPAY